MSSAKQAMSSTIKRVLIHMAEIIASIILLVIISLPLVFVIPMWFQQVAFGTTIADLAVNPVSWFGLLGAVGVTTLITIVSLVIGYGYLMGLSHRIKKKDAEGKASKKSESSKDAELSEETGTVESDGEVLDTLPTETEDTTADSSE